MLNAKKIALIILLGFFVGFGAFAESQPPPPRPRESSQNYQGSSTKANKNSNTDQYYTQDKPLFVKIVGSDGTNPNTTKQGENINQRSSSKDIIGIIGNILTACATVAIAIFAFFQVKAMRSQKRSMDNQLEVMRESISLTREDFIANHPANLQVNSVSLHTPGSGSNWSIQCRIDNIGRSTALIKSSNMTFKKIETALPRDLPFSEESHALTEIPIESGENITGQLILKDLNKTNEDAGFEAYSAFLGYYFFGYINYTDSIGTKKRTAFCRTYDCVSNRFAPVDDEDHEYSY